MQATTMQYGGLRLARRIVACLLAAQVPAMASGVALSGQFAVSESGAATYSIPIKVPPGVAGMAPSLNLAYNSQGVSGLAGTGWGLSGLSVITRCPRTMAQDGVRGGVHYDGNDRFCMDGHRLVLVGGTYGQDGAEYRTERDGMARIVSYGSAGNGPLYFKVWTKAGQVMEFGATADSRIEAVKAPGSIATWPTGSVRVWALSEFADAKGNRMRVQYTEDSATSEYVPSRIAYAHPTPSAEGNASIEFMYTTRPNVLTGYGSGGLHRASKLLTRIRTIAQGLPVTDYVLEYETTGRTNESRLRMIKSCDVSGACLLPINITWTDGGNDTFTSDVGIGAGAGSGAFNNWLVKQGDFNGDGKGDLFLSEPSGTYRKRILLSNGDGTFPQEVATGYDGVFGNAGIEPSDFNDDGRADVLFIEGASPNRKRVAMSNGGGTLGSDSSIGFDGAFNGAAVYLADFNGDGRTDIFFVERTSPHRKRISLGGGGGTFGNDIATGYDNIFNGAKIHIGNFNGDAFADVLFDEGPSLRRRRIALGNGNGTLGPDIATGYDGVFSDNTIIQTADFNGDGLTDILFSETDGAFRKRIAFGRGDGTLTSDIGFGWDGIAGWNVYPADFNGDGLTDLLLDETQGTYRKRIMLGLGNGTFSGDFAIGLDNAFPGWAVYVGDFDGDGRADLLFDEKQGTYRKKTVLSRLKRPGLLAEIGNGVQTFFNVSYQPLTNSTVYTKDTTATYPRINVQGPMFVVSETKANNGVGGQNATQYTYGGLQGELGTGRGMLGFHWRKSKNLSTGVENYVEFRQDWPFIGMVAKAETRLTGSGNGGLLKRSTTTYAQGPGSASPSVFVYASQSVEESWDLNGTQLPTTTTTNQYSQSPQYGDPTQIQVTLSDGSSKTTVNEYWPVNTGGGNWILGRLKKASVTSNKP